MIQICWRSRLCKLLWPQIKCQNLFRISFFLLLLIYQFFCSNWYSKSCWKYVVYLASRIRRTLEIRGGEAPSMKALVEMSVDSYFFGKPKKSQIKGQCLFWARMKEVTGRTDNKKKKKEYQNPHPKLFCKLVVVVKASVLSEGGWR